MQCKTKKIAEIMTNPRTFNSCVTCPKPNSQALLRLFWFPYAGGGTSIFRTWSNNLPPEVEVSPIQLPGHENRLLQPVFTSLIPLFHMLERVLLQYLILPFVFFGHSMGVLISFELAHHLRRQHCLGLLLLFVSARRAPQILSSNGSIHHLPESAFIEALRHFNCAPVLVLQIAELMDLLLPVLRADFAFGETYFYSIEKPLACAISAFGSLQDCEVSCDELVAWRSFLSAQCSSISFTVHDPRFNTAASKVNGGQST